MKTKILIWTLALILLAMPVLGALTDNQKAYFTLDDAYLSGTTVIDSVNAYNLTNTGATTGVNGVINEAFLFGSGDVLNANDNSLLAVGTANFTINFWINKTSNSATTETPFQLYETSSGNPNSMIMWLDHGSGDVYFKIDKGATEENVIYNGIDWAGTGFNMLTLVRDVTAGKCLLYINATNVANNTCSAYDLSGNDGSCIGAQCGPTNTISGNIDEFGVWQAKALSLIEVEQLFNSGAGLQYPYSGGPSPTTDIDFTAIDDWTGASITNFAINVSWPNGTTTEHSTTNGTISLVNISDSTIDINVTYWNVTDYFDITLIDETITVNTTNSVQAEIFQAQICFNATQKVNEAWITLDNVTINSTTRTASPFCFNLTADTHDVLAQKAGYYPHNQSFAISALQNQTLTVQNLSYANLTVYVIDGTTNESLSGYNVNITSTSNPSYVESSTGVTNHSIYLINDTYTVTVYKAGYAITTGTANVTVAGDTNKTFTLYRSNSVTINIFDEISNDPILSNITIRWTNNATTWENVTDTGNLFVSNLTPSNYSLLFYGSNYSTRTYTITVGNLSTQFLNAYMISSEYSTIFTIKDQDTGEVLPDVSFTMYKLVNSTWTTVESKYSDITGKVQVYYDPIGNYRFYCSVADYEDLIFYLDPILFATYDVKMVKNTVINYTVDYDDISIVYSPQIFDNNDNTTFNFLISSPDGLLTDYGITLTYPGGSTSDSGVNAIGEQLSVWVNITNATRWDRVRLDYNYTTTIAGTRTFTQYFSIATNATASENTYMANKDRTFGLGLFERVLICTIIVIFVVGIASLVGQPLPGMAIGLFVYGYLAKIGFIPLWAILPSMLIGVLFITWKSGGY